MSTEAMNDAVDLLGDLIIEWHGHYEIAIREGIDITPHVQRVADRLAKDASTIDALLSFAAEALNRHWEGQDDTLQELGLKHGLLVRTIVSAPCSTVCACAEAGADFPTECYRYSPEILAARQRLADASKAVKP